MLLKTHQRVFDDIFLILRKQTLLILKVQCGSRKSLVSGQKAQDGDRGAIIS